jgi:hypothetical protein
MQSPKNVKRLPVTRGNTPTKNVKPMNNIQRSQITKIFKIAFGSSDSKGWTFFSISAKTISYMAEASLYNIKLTFKDCYITEAKSTSLHRVLMPLNSSTQTTVISIHSVLAAHDTNLKTETVPCSPAS